MPGWLCCEQEGCACAGERDCSALLSRSFPQLLVLCALSHVLPPIPCAPSCVCCPMCAAPCPVCAVPCLLSHVCGPALPSALPCWAQPCSVHIRPALRGHTGHVWRRSPASRPHELSAQLCGQTWQVRSPGCGDTQSGSLMSRHRPHTQPLAWCPHCWGHGAAWALGSQRPLCFWNN